MPMLKCSSCKRETTKLVYPVGETRGLCPKCWGDSSDTPLQSKSSHKGTYYPASKGAPAVKFNWKSDHGGRGLHCQYLSKDPGEIRELAAMEDERCRNEQ